MANKTSFFHKLKTVLFYSIASIVIIIALSISGLRLVLTTANLYQEEVEELASNLLEQKVNIGRMDAKLTGLMPTLIFYDVQLLSTKTKKPLFSLARIDVGLSFESLIRQQKIIPEQITIKGMDLHVTRTVDGQYKVKGFDLDGLLKAGDSTSSSEFESWLLQKGEVGLEDSSITWVDEQNSGLIWDFHDVNFLLKKNENRHQFIISSRLPRSLGSKVKLSLDIIGDITTPSTWTAKAFVESKYFKLAPLQAYIKNENFKVTNGVANIKLWLDWQENKPKQLSGDVKLRNVEYQLDENEVVRLNLVSGVFDSGRDKNNMWHVSVDKFNYTSDVKVLNGAHLSLAFNYIDENIETFHIKTDFLKLEDLSKIISDNHLLKQKHENIVDHLSLQGEIHDFYIAWKENELYRLNARFNNLATSAWGNLPKITELSGKILYQQPKGNILLSAENSIIGFPDLFRQDFKFDQLNADINFSSTQQGLYFDTQHLRLKNSAVTAVSSAKLWLPFSDSSPYLDFQTYVSEGDISKVSHFLPVTIMEEGLVNWLDKGLLKGNVDKATVVFNGQIKDFPFDKNEGVFSVDLNVSDVVINYLDGWPRIKNATATGDITGQGLKFDFLTAETKNNILYNSSLVIDSFLNAELDVNIFATGSSYTTAQYLVNSPILSNAAKTINSMRFSGDIATNVKINLPLSDEASKQKSLTYTGSAKLTNAAVFMADDKIDITKGSGFILFTEKGLSSKKLTANILNKKAKFTFGATKKYKSIKISIDGKMEPGDILKRFKIPGANNISGTTTFYANMIFPSAKAKYKQPRLNVYSNLVGVKSTFPEFLYKRKKTYRKAKFSTIFSAANKIQFSANFTKRGSAIIELDQSGSSPYLNRGAISFSRKKARLPRKKVLYVDGSINKFTPSRWIKALNLKKLKGKKPFFVNPVIFNLNKLKIISKKDTKKKSKSASINPRKLPAFEGIIKKLYYNKTFLGRLDFKISKKKKGLYFEEVILSSKNMKLFSHGDWRYTRGRHNTKMDFTLSSGDFGKMLTGFGFKENIRKGNAQATGKLKWKGAPTEFSLKKLNGDVQLILTNGNIKEIDAGAGRLLGIFSLTALPRKLFGDFNGSFDDGFSFDSAEGEITIENGDAYTEDFEITSPIADITVNGRTGLVDRDYENIVEVVPDVGGSLAGLTALLVNLPAGIGLWLVDKITGEQIDDASAKSYEVSGTWDKPVVVEVERE